MSLSSLSFTTALLYICISLSVHLLNPEKSICDLVNSEVSLTPSHTKDIVNVQYILRTEKGLPKLLYPLIFGCTFSVLKMANTVINMITLLSFELHLLRA